MSSLACMRGKPAPLLHPAVKPAEQPALPIALRIGTRLGVPGLYEELSTARDVMTW